MDYSREPFIDPKTSFMCQLYKIQSDEGRLFLHEHPIAATSWKLGCMKEAAALRGACMVRCDLCMLASGHSGSILRKAVL